MHMAAEKLHPGALPAATAQKSAWVQTDKAVHEAWGQLITAKPRAGALLHHITARAGTNNVLVVSQKSLAKIMGCGLRTVQYAVADLVDGRWLQVVKLNGPGTVSAYVLNDRVAWSTSREKLHMSIFSATVIADFEDQEPEADGLLPLRQIPTLYPGERQLPTGPGQKPPSQPNLDGLEPDLPAFENPDPWVDDRAKLEAMGQLKIDLSTGEIVGPDA